MAPLMSCCVAASHAKGEQHRHDDRSAAVNGLANVERVIKARLSRTANPPPAVAYKVTWNGTWEAFFPVTGSHFEGGGGDFLCFLVGSDSLEAFFAYQCARLLQGRFRLVFFWWWWLGPV